MYHTIETLVSSSLRNYLQVAEEVVTRIDDLLPLRRQFIFSPLHRHLISLLLNELFSSLAAVAFDDDQEPDAARASRVA